MNSSPDLYLLAGPNGAGKTSFSLAEAFPTTAARTAALLISEDGPESNTLAAGSSPSVEIQVTGPDGETAAAATDSLQAGGRRWASAPNGLGMVADLRMKLSESGRYRVHVLVSIGDEHVESQTSFYVVASSR